MKPIPYARQSIDEKDVQAVIEVLRSDFLTQGPAIERFERAVAEYCGARFAVAVSNATAGLHVACLALQLKPGQLLWTSPNTFPASANCGLYCGADVDFVDIDPLTFNISVEALAKKLAHAKKLPDVLVPVHFTGQPCEMARIHELAKRYKFKVIEDASHAVGGSYRGRKIGSCEFSDLNVFSFHPVKIITTGEGGIVTTNDPELHKRLMRMRTHGITRDTSLMTHAMDGPWYYQQLDLGFNYRITDIQAALGLSQLGRIDDFVKRRQELVRRYDEALADLPLSTQRRNPDAVSAHHLYVIRLRLDRIKKTHRQVYEELQAKGIMVNLHYIPVHLHPYYEGLGFKAGQFPEAETYYREAISLPMFYELRNEDQDCVVAALQEVLR